MISKFVAFTFSVIMAVSVAKRTSKDKSLLYERYPQLISNDTDPCIRGLNQILINMNSEDLYEKMVLASLHGLDDLGSKSLCEEGQIDLAHYSTLNINVTHLPVALINGICLPASCSVSQLESFGTGLTTKINNLLIAV